MQWKMLIGADWVDAKSKETIDCVNPATEEVFGQVPAGGKEDVAKAAAAAREAFENGWGRTTGTERGRLLRGIAEGIRARKAELAKYETMDAGKPGPESDFAMDTAAQIYDMYAGLAEKLDVRGQQEVEQPNEGLRTTVEYSPVGVVGMITPP